MAGALSPIIICGRATRQRQKFKRPSLSVWRRRARLRLLGCNSFRLPATPCLPRAFEFTACSRRLLKYWSGPRCCRFWRWPRRDRSADIRSDLGQASNTGPRQNRRNPSGARQKGGWPQKLSGLAASLARCSPLRGCASLAPCHPPFCLYARPTPAFQQSPSNAGVAETADLNHNQYLCVASL